jgi:hypothetical protein
MNKQMKKQPSFQLGKEVSKSEQKKVIGGANNCPGTRCVNSQMGCTTANITSGYCWAVWSASRGVIEPCYYATCYS